MSKVKDLARLYSLAFILLSCMHQRYGVLEWLKLVLHGKGWTMAFLMAGYST